jgi:hypothetical protein
VKNNYYVLAIKFINNVNYYLLDNNIIKKVKHNTIYTFENNVIIYVAKKLSLVPLRVNKIDFVVDSKIGAIYTETFLDFDSIQKVYALGHRTNLENKPITFYIDKDTFDSDKLIINII